MLELLVGHVASGKSTYSAQMASKGAVIVNNDNIIKLVHGDNYKLYNSKFKPLYKSIESTIVQMGLAMGKHVVVDNLNHTFNTRLRHILIAKSFDVKTKITVMPMHDSLTHAKRRFESDSRGYSLDHWLKVIEEHASNFEMPIEDECDELVFL